MRLQPRRALPSKKWPTFLAIFVLAGVAMTAWSLSGPVDSTPDEDFHLTSIWCGQGIDNDHCRAGDAPGQRTVPYDLVEKSRCFISKSAESAKCLGKDFGDDPTPNFSTARGNFVPDYPPVYFATLHTLAGDDISASVLRMRAFNTLVFLTITAAMMALVTPMLRRVTAWSFLLMSVPHGIWLVSSINPSGWATISAGTFWVGLYALPDARGWRRPTLAAATVVSGLIGTGSRTDSCLFTLIAVVLVLILRRDRILTSKLSLAIAAVVAFSAVLFFLRAGQSSAALDGFGPLATNGFNSAQLLWSNLQNFPSMWTGLFGTWPLGWIDTPMPPIVLVCALLPWSAIVFASLRNIDRRQMIVLLLLAAALVTYPLFLVTRSNLLIGQGVQPRYLLPLMVMLTGMALLVTRRPSISLSRGQIALATVSLSIANSIALHNNIRRYVTGTDVVGFNLNRDREWWWNMPVAPMGVWAIGSVAFALVAYLVLTTFPSGDDADGIDPLDANDGRHRQEVVAGPEYSTIGGSAIQSLKS